MQSLTVEHIGQLLLMARGGRGEGDPPPPRPWFPPALVVRAVYALTTRQGGLEEQKRALWGKVGGWA